MPSSNGTLVVGPGDLLLDVPTAGLTELTSYRSTLITTFVGTEDGQSRSWSMKSTLANGGSDVGRHFTLSVIGDGAPAEPSESWRRRGITYTAASDGACSARQVEDGASLQSNTEPAAVLPAVAGAESAGIETVDGITANHYTFDERAIGLDGLADATGELWLAQDGQYLLRYRLTVTGADTYFGPASQGNLSYDYEASDVNQPVAIDLPADCPQGLIDAPVPAGATSVLNVPGLLQYETAANVDEALAYYSDQATALGWTLIQGPLTTDGAGLIEYTSGRGPISILVTAGETATTVSITFGEPAQP